MENIQVISKRCSVLIKDKIISLVILPTEEKRKTTLLFLWLLAWTISGVIVFANYFTLKSTDTKLILVIWLGFWGYFEFKIAKVFMWKRFGKEKLWIKDGALFYQQDINGRGKIQQFDLNLISNFDFIELEKANISDVFSQTFWVKGGERISFHCQARLIKFGLQLPDDDAQKIITTLRKFIK